MVGKNLYGGKDGKQPAPPREDVTCETLDVTALYSLTRSTYVELVSTTIWWKCWFLFHNGMISLYVVTLLLVIFVFVLCFLFNKDTFI